MGGWGHSGAARDLECGELFEGFDGGAIGSEDLHAEEVASGVFLEAHHHLLEHLEGLLLVGDERVLLGVAAEADAFLEVVHVEEVFFPEAVEDGEHDDALVVAELDFAEDLLLDVVARGAVRRWFRRARGGLSSEG